MSRITIDDLEVLTPDQLGGLLRNALMTPFPDVQFIQDILDVGCPIETRSNYGRTALHLGAEKGYLEVVELLVSNGADIQARSNDGWTALHHAVWNKGMDVIEVIKLLISIGADIKARANDGQTAWDYANDEIQRICPELEPK